MTGPVDESEIETVYTDVTISDNALDNNITSGPCPPNVELDQQQQQEGMSKNQIKREKKRKIKRLRDENGFRLRRQMIDASIRTAISGTVSNLPSENRSPTTAHVLQNKENQNGDVPPTIAQEMEQGWNYYFENGLRKVPAYYFTYLTYCKRRWENRTIWDIVTDEFRIRNEDYYQKAIETGQVLVNGQPISGDRILQSHELLSHRTHKHEPPVVDTPIEILSDDGDVVAINKPSGVPVHPTGRHRYNTVTKILEHERGFIVHPCNRLDRLTSGLMFLARTSTGADRISSMIRSREVYKEYVARVLGDFPEGDEIRCDVPLRSLDPRLGLHRVSRKLDDPGTKEATSLFAKIAYDPQSNTSLVKCQPLTGRTHQLRLHLQYLGHPIANDPLYANKRLFGDSLGKDGAGDDKEIIQRMEEMGKTQILIDKTHMEQGMAKEKSQDNTEDPPTDDEAIIAAAEAKRVEKQILGEKLSGEECQECFTELYSDPCKEELILWLHARKYAAKDASWSFETPIPDWARGPFRLSSVD